MKEYLCRKFLQMLKKGSKLYSILTGSCPKCQEESMYEVKNPYKLNTIYKMHEKCSHCKTQYKIEPSFFYGAMYVSYGVSIAFGVAFFVLSRVLFKTTLGVSFITIAAGLIALTPIISRVSRNIYINLFVHFDKNWKDNS